MTPAAISAVPNQSDRPLLLLGCCYVKRLHLLQKQPETRHNKTKAHQGQPGAHPRKKGALRGKIIAERGFLRRCRGLLHDGLCRFLPLFYATRSIVTDSSTTGLCGLSCALRATLEMPVTISWPSTTSPKMV